MGQVQQGRDDVVMEQVVRPGTRLHPLKGGSWLLLRFDGKETQGDAEGVFTNQGQQSSWGNREQR